MAWLSRYGMTRPAPLPLAGQIAPKMLGPLGTLVMRRTRVRAAARTTAGDLVILTDPGFVLLSDLDIGADRKPSLDPLQSPGGVFLNASSASGSWA